MKQLHYLSNTEQLFVKIPRQTPLVTKLLTVSEYFKLKKDKFVIVIEFSSSSFETAFKTFHVTMWIAFDGEFIISVELWRAFQPVLFRMHESVVSA